MSNTFYISASGNFVLQTVGGAVLERIDINNAGAAAGSTITIYDSPTASGTILGILHASAVSTQGTYEYHSQLQNGLTIANGNPASDLTIVLGPPQTSPSGQVD